MSTEEAKRRAKKKFIAEKLEGISFRVPVGQKSRIQEHAKSQGESTNAFIYRAVNEAIERDEKADREEWSERKGFILELSKNHEEMNDGKSGGGYTIHGEKFIVS